MRFFNCLAEIGTNRRFRWPRNAMEEILSLTLPLRQAMFLHIKPKLLASLYKGICLFKTAHFWKHFILQEHILKAVFWSMVSTWSIIKQNILTCRGSVRLLLKWMKTLLLVSTWARPQASNRTLLTEVLFCEEESRILQINPDNKPPQTQAEIIPALIIQSVSPWTQVSFTSLCTLCLYIGNWRVHWRREVQTLHINCAHTWV